MRRFVVVVVVAALRRRTLRRVLACLTVTVVALHTGTAKADVFSMPSGQTSLQFVNVGDPGNAADTTGFGRVDSAYRIGKFDVTAAQYGQFLNAVAKTDPYGLYSSSMAPGFSAGCGITQSGSSGNYSYAVASGHEDFPVNWVSWGDAARFCNWLRRR